jgi:hypothetical protein
MEDENEERIIKDSPVIISKPIDGGKVQTHEITADFLLLDQDQYDNLMESLKDSSESPDAGILRKVVRNLKGFTDADDKPIDFSASLLERVVKVQYMRRAIVVAYIDMSAGNKAKRKNS